MNLNLFLDIGVLQGIGTILAMIAILSVFAWAYSGKRKARFDEAAMLPFADDDLDHHDAQRQLNKGNDTGSSTEKTRS